MAYLCSRPRLFARGNPPLALARNPEVRPRQDRLRHRPPGSDDRHQSREFVIRSAAMSPFEITRSVTMINAELVNRPGELGVGSEPDRYLTLWTG